MESEDPHGSGVRGGLAVFFLLLLWDDVSRRRPPKKGLLLFNVRSVCVVVLDV